MFAAGWSEHYSLPKWEMWGILGQIFPTSNCLGLEKSQPHWSRLYWISFYMVDPSRLDSIERAPPRIGFNCSWCHCDASSLKFLRPCSSPRCSQSVKEKEEGYAQIRRGFSWFDSQRICKTKSKAWHKSKFGKMEQTICELEEELKGHCANLDTVQNREKQLLLEQLLLKQESHLKQQNQND